MICVNLSDILILFIARISLGICTESYALLISRLRICSCWLYCFASSMTVCKMCIYSWVLDSGRAAQLCCERIWYLTSIETSRLFRIFVKIFLAASRSVIGLVILRLFSQSLGLGMG